MPTLAEAIEFLNAGFLAEAEAACRALLAADPERVDGLLLLADIELGRGRPDAAIASWRRVIAARPSDAATHRRLAGALLTAGRPAEAVPLLRRALELEPDNARALNNLGQALTATGQPAAALPPLTRALEIEPGYAIAHHNLGVARQRLGAIRDAFDNFKRALEIKPDFCEAFLNMGHVALELGDAAGALQAFDSACSLRPALGPVHAGRGLALEAQGLADQAIDAYSRAVALGWVDGHALIRVGAMLVQLNRFENAYAAFSAAARLLPDSWRAKEGIAMTLIALRRFEAAIPALEELVHAAPWVNNLPGQLFHARLNCCDWRDFQPTASDIARRVRKGERIDLPWSFLIHNAEPAEQLACARIYAEDKCTGIRPLRRGRRASKRIRLAYLSADFHGHATSYLAAGLFESHDRSRFETTAISYGPPDEGPMRMRLMRAFERFLDVPERSDEAIAALIDELGIDIAVDMKGFTTGGRPRILAYRPAPVQVAFLAFPGTMGCGFIDYIVADRLVIPDSDRRHYSEKIIWMPGSYQINDSDRSAAPDIRRRDAGLAEDDFVFCCFNASYKFTPEVFRSWMRILAQVDGSVLWLLEGSAAAVRNLRVEAERCGIPASRLVFAPPLPPAEHWARISLADLFLDTLPCNAHTTASDSLWAGVPVITVTGATFAGRVATSLLNAAGVPELCVPSLVEYERLAVRLARTPAQLAAFRSRVRAARHASLFDTVGYCRQLESAFAEIHGRHRRGEPAVSFDVAAVVAR